MDEPINQPTREGMVIAPSGIGEVLDLGFNLARHNYALLVQVAAWGAIPAYVGLAITQGYFQVAATSAQFSAIGILLAILGFAVLAIGLALAGIALTLACLRLVRPSGEPNELSPGWLYNAAPGSLGRLILLIIVVGLLAIPLMIVFPLGIFLYVRWSMAGIAVIGEESGPIAALGRSWALTNGSWWHTSGVLFCASFVVGVLSTVLSGVFGAVGGVVGFALGNPVLGVVLNTAGSAAANIALLPFSTAISVVLYYELRARTEGFDLEQRALHVISPA